MNRRVKLWFLYSFVLAVCVVGTLQSWRLATLFDIPRETVGLVPKLCREFKRTEPRRAAPRTVRKTDCHLDLATCSSCKAKNFFSPRHNIRKLLLEMLDGEQERVQIAAFRLTDRSIADKLIELHKRGVKVELLVDSGGLDSHYNKPLELHKEKVPVAIFPNKAIAEKSRYTIMHHKFIVLHKPALTNGAQKVVITGSLNLTKSALDSNCENIVVLVDNELAKGYSEEFEYIIANEADLL